jgi:tRNA-uridine 2-sulfurtransferase
MKRPKVVVGMSGGMDSSAAAAILVDQGYDVHGITLKVWHEEENPDRRWQERSCCKVGLARYVAGRLDIPLRVMDVEATFKNVVVDDFVSGYLAGRTPNPCVRCNERIKFGLLYQSAMDIGADYLATGHYVRLEKGADGQYRLKQGVDGLKDQSYFLYRLRPEILPRLMFPLGSYRKPDVWRWIEKLGLPPEEMHESQEICFVTQGDYREFLSLEAPQSARSGHFVTRNGEVLGTHRGVAFYTVGQRRGLGIASSRPGERLYVLEIDSKTDRVVVGRKEELYSIGLTATEVHYMGRFSLTEPVEIEAKIRYRSPKIPATLEAMNGRRATISFREPQRAVTPGQSVVFYQGEVLMGGGIIDSVRREKTVGIQLHEELSVATLPGKPAQDQRDEESNQEPVHTNHE